MGGAKGLKEFQRKAKIIFHLMPDSVRFVETNVYVPFHALASGLCISKHSLTTALCLLLHGI